MQSLCSNVAFEYQFDHPAGVDDPEQRFLDHVAICDGCDRYLHQIRDTPDDHYQSPERGSLAGIHVETYTGPRADLRALFRLAEDSTDQLDSYIALGRVLVAVSGDEVIGHLQPVDTDDPDQVEIKNMAVRETDQGHGVAQTRICSSCMCPPWTR